MLIHHEKELLHNLLDFLSVSFGKLSIFHSLKIFSEQYGIPEIYDAIFFRVWRQGQPRAIKQHGLFRK